MITSFSGLQTIVQFENMFTEANQLRSLELNLS